jgi:hypothetical protein
LTKHLIRRSSRHPPPGWRGARIYAPRMRDREVIDPELRLLLAIRHMAREAEGRTPNTARMDALLDERTASARR